MKLYRWIGARVSSVDRPGTAFKKTIAKLNSLMTNNAAVQESIGSSKISRQKKLDRTQVYLDRVGISLNDLKKLSVIHVAGTKGKGSTSSLCESILRQNGYKTGLYTSPHLICVTERIRINGKPIDNNLFVRYFNETYDDLISKRDNDADMPMYFGFLTVMVFKIFLEENVDVAVVEVGIGGKYDMTNIVNNVPVVGITSLGFDHTALLGNRIEDIAEQKAGIMKPGCVAYTVQQPESALQILREVAQTTKCELNIAPDYNVYKSYDPERMDATVNPAKYLNASLAIQLAHSWMQHNNSKERNIGNIIDVPESTFRAVESCNWPGRCQIVRTDRADVYIDGAHTAESMEMCSNWYKCNYRKSSPRILIFYTTKGRNPEPMMKCLIEHEFDAVLFVSNTAYDDSDPRMLVDQIDKVTQRCRMERCEQHAEIWKELNGDACEVRICNNVSEAFDFAQEYKERPQILVTGSLYLVGAALVVLSPYL